jgi:energy-coupling factor transporter ATP-binding protein EcfA2
MAIQFQTLKWKNFLSTGNSFTELDFREHKTNLIVGHNGAGKSTLLDALSFALFGKAHRNIGKPQLVNSINNKDCVVEVNFSVAGSAFRIIRGIKPNIFEIYKNGELINQDSHNKEYQKILEANILKLNHKSFHQIVVLGSSSFIPFMQLPAQHRRDVIEDLLDINVFSKMNQILKEKNSLLKDQIKDVGYKIDLQSNKIDTQKKYIQDINRINKDLKDQKLAEIDGMRTQMSDLNIENDELRVKINEQSEVITTSISKCEKKREELIGYDNKFKSEIKSVVKEAKFFEDNCTCPTCSQDIDEEIKKEKLSIASTKAKELTSALNKLSLELSVTEEKLVADRSIMEQVRLWQQKQSANIQVITHIQKSINGQQIDINNLTDTTSDISKAKEDLDSYIELKNSMTEDKLELNEQFQYNQCIAEMLKDTGIKTKIVKQYLPVINRLVNQYLQILDFFVHFNLDESFQESIRSRHRDSFSYDSFSEGEKQRIDLALLFTWRMIAKMKNSVSTNLLILDETFDSSLDYEGVDNLMKIIHELDDDTNVFVISHKGDILDGKFARKIEFFKDKNFSKIK